MHVLRKLTGCLSTTTTTTTCDNDQIRENEPVDANTTSTTTTIFSQLAIFRDKIKHNKVNTPRNIKQIPNMSEG